MPARATSAPASSEAPSASPYTFIMRGAGVASGGFSCQVTRGPDLLPSTPPARLVVIVTTDRTPMGGEVPCVIPTPAGEDGGKR